MVTSGILLRSSASLRTDWISSGTSHILSLNSKSILTASIARNDSLPIADFGSA